MKTYAVCEARIKKIKQLIDELYKSGNCGDILEFGVFEGRSLSQIVLQLRLNGMINKVYGFDSFCGLPELKEGDGGWQKGQFSSSYENTKQQMMSILEHLNDINLIQGFYENSLTEELNNKINNIALIHVDCDFYSSARTVLNWCSNKISKGTIIVFDEWRSGENKAFDEFVNKYKFDFENYGNVEQQHTIKIKGLKNE